MLPPADEVAAGEPSPTKRVPGRPRGAKTKKSSKILTIAKIIEVADPLRFLADVVNGQAFRAPDENGVYAYTRPTLDQRIQAARYLAGKILPDLRAIDLKSVSDGTLNISLVSYIDRPTPTPALEAASDADPTDDDDHDT